MASNVYVHYIFSTYKRRQVLIDPVVISQLCEWFIMIAKEKKFIIIAVSILNDHVHLLIEHRADDTSKYVMKCIKGISSREFFKSYPKSPRFIFKKLWSKSYKACSVTPDKLNRVIGYINNQKTKDGIDKRFFIEPTRLASGLNRFTSV
jgi:REP element-mobilizing transposase RayT